MMKVIVRLVNRVISFTMSQNLIYIKPLKQLIQYSIGLDNLSTD